MAREVMRRQAADNEYRHPDFHGALSTALEYLHRQYGEEAVREYLHRFARAYYAPLTAAIAREGLAPLRAHLEAVYGGEGAEFTLTGGDEDLLLAVAACPALSHMRQRGYPIAGLWGETTITVLAALCEGTPWACEVLEYDRETGRCRVRFARRGA